MSFSFHSRTPVPNNTMLQFVDLPPREYSQGAVAEIVLRWATTDQYPFYQT